MRLVVNKTIVKNLIFAPVYFLRGEKVFELIKQYQRLERDGAEAINSYKQKRIQELCRYASQNVPFFKNLGIGGGADLSAFPVLNKGVLRNSLDDFMVLDAPHSWRSTSGSTGTPFVFPKDRVASAHMDALMHHFYSWYGVDIGDRQARVWGTKLKAKDKVVQYLYDFLLNRKRLSAFFINDSNCRDYFNHLKRFRPEYFYAYSNALYQFALSLEKQNLDGRQLAVKVAICTGEVLFDFHREKIEQVFGCKVVNEYGSTENGIIAFECSKNRLHVAPTLEVEIINPDANGYGNVVITELHSKAMPFIRYDIGDVARFVDIRCECGKPQQVIEVKEGRRDDYVKCPDGSLVYDAIFAYVLKDHATRFKVIQEFINEIHINIIPKTGYSVDNNKQILSVLREHLGKEMNVDFHIVEDIPPERSGKLRYFISNVK